MNKEIQIGLVKGIEVYYETPNEKIILVIMKIYSLEIFLYREGNRASSDRDHSKIVNLGSFAYVLSKNYKELTLQ